MRLRIEASPELERIVSKCLETDHDLLYQHAADLRTDLESFTRGSDASAGEQHAAKTRARWAMVAAAAAAIAVAAVVGYIFYPRPSPLADKDTIVLTEFTNKTGDPVFDDTLRQGLAVQLQHSTFLSLISDERIRRTLLLMNQPADARLTPDIARVVCVRTSGAAVLQGSIAALGSQYVLGLPATTCASSCGRSRHVHEPAAEIVPNSQPDFAAGTSADDRPLYKRRQQGAMEMSTCGGVGRRAFSSGWVA